MRSFVILSSLVLLYVYASDESSESGESLHKIHPQEVQAREGHSNETGEGFWTKVKTGLSHAGGYIKGIFHHNNGTESGESHEEHNFPHHPPMRNGTGMVPPGNGTGMVPPGNGTGMVPPGNGNRMGPPPPKNTTAPLFLYVLVPSRINYSFARRELSTWYDHLFYLVCGISTLSSNLSRKVETSFSVSMEDDNVQDEMVVIKQEVDNENDGSMADASSETDNDIGDADMVDNEGRVARTGPDGEIEADLGDTIRNYVILRELGSGTFAKVFAVEDSANPAAGELALKVVRAHLDYSTPSRREAAMLRRLNTHHPQKARFIVPLLREFDFSQHHCMLFPVFGLDVVAFMDRNGGRGFPVDQVRRMAFDVLSGLEYLHSLGIVHTDMKPENVLFRNDRFRTERRDDGEEVYLLDEASVVICDLNSAVNTAVDTMPAGTIQTLNYRAPEVIFDLERGCPMDVWSAACLLYEVMWGTIMFDSVDDDNTMPSRLRHLALIHRTLAERSMDPYCDSLTFLPRHLTTVFLNVLVELEMEDLADSRKPWEQLDGVEKRNFDALLRSMLLVDPDVRATAGDALKSRFLEQLS